MKRPKLPKLLEAQLDLDILIYGNGFAELVENKEWVRVDPMSINYEVYKMKDEKKAIEGQEVYLTINNNKHSIKKTYKVMSMVINASDKIDLNESFRDINNKFKDVVVLAGVDLVEITTEPEPTPTNPSYVCSTCEMEFEINITKCSQTSTKYELDYCPSCGNEIE